MPPDVGKRSAFPSVAHYSDSPRLSLGEAEAVASQGSHARLPERQSLSAHRRAKATQYKNQLVFWRGKVCHEETAGASHLRELKMFPFSLSSAVSHLRFLNDKVSRPVSDYAE